MKKIKSCLLIIALCVAASHAGAVPWYIGGSYGLAEFDTGVTSLTGATFLDENDNGYKFYVGANATDNIALEFGRVDFGQFQLGGNSGDGFNYEGASHSFTQNQTVMEFEGDAFFFSALAKWQAHEDIAPFARIGVHVWDVTANVSNTTLSQSIEEDGTDLFYGCGVDFSLTDSMTIRTEYEHFVLENKDVGLLSAGIVYYIPQ